MNDGNGNGIPDDQEVDAARAYVSRSLVSSAVFVEPTALEVSSVDTAAIIERIGLLDPLEFDVHESTPDVLPCSMLAYRVVIDQPGQMVALTIHLSAAMPAGVQWVGYDDINGWKPYADQATVANDRKSVTIEVRDGGFGDADGVANGIILDSAGLQPTSEGTGASAAVADTAGVAGSDTEAGAGGGGCFLAAASPCVQDETPGWDWIRQRILDWWAAGPGAW